MLSSRATIDRKRKSNSASPHLSLTTNNSPASKRTKPEQTLDAHFPAVTNNTNSSRASTSSAASPPSSGSMSVAVPAKKKLVIKPFKVAPAPPAAFEATTFANLSEAVDCVFESRASALSQEELYRAVESLCMHKKSEQLFTQLKQQCDQHTSRKIEALARHSQSSTVSDLDALNALASTWQNHCTHLLTLRSIFLYLDRTYILHQSVYHSLWEMGLQLFCTHWTAALDGQLECRTRNSLMSIIERERQGESVPRSLLRSLLLMYVAIHRYSTLFEPAFLSASKRFYTTEAISTIAAFTLPDYLHHANTRLTQEAERLSAYLDPSTTGPLTSLVELALLSDHSTRMLEKGFEALMREKRVNELGLMFTLFQRIHRVDEIKNAFSSYVKAMGSAIMNGDASKEATMVTDLLSFKSDLDAILHCAFQSSSPFLHAMKVAFEYFLNLLPNKPAELIAKHFDRLLRTGGAKGATVDELDDEMERVMFLFRYIQGKDVFAAFYSKDLARRLLLNASASIDAEKSLIAKLKAECGASFTTKLEGMFKDMELSKDMQQQFVRHLQQLPHAPPIELAVHVLTQGSWPAYPAVDFALPDEVCVLQDEFKSFYLHHHNGRRLQWQNALATAILRANFPRGRKELQVNAMQAAVLLCFNPSQSQSQSSTAMNISEPSQSSSSSSSSTAIAAAISHTSPSSSSSPPSFDSPALSFRALLDMTKLNEVDLKRTLQSLCLHDTIRVLTKDPRSRTISDVDIFHVDLTFRSSLFRIKLPSLSARETKEEQSAVASKVFEDRQYALDAAIVRIMKARKTLSHAELMSETIAAFAAKFPVKPTDIKKRIATLIDREYMERDSDNAHLYQYLA